MVTATKQGLRSTQISYLTNVSGGTLLSPVTDLQAVIAGPRRERRLSAWVWDGAWRHLPERLSELDRRRLDQLPRWLERRAGQLARVRLQFEQAQAQLKNLEMQVATQVRGAARNVQTNQQRVRSAERRAAAGKEAGGRGKETGGRHVVELLRVQAQRDLAQARTIEIQAISTTTNRWSISRPQQVPLGGGGGGITTAGSGAVATNGSSGLVAVGDWGTTGLGTPQSPSPQVPSPVCYTRPSAEALGHGHHQNEAATSATRWRLSHGPTNSSSSTRAAPTRPWRSPGSTPIGSSFASGPDTSPRRTTPRRSPRTTGFCRWTPTSGSHPSSRRKSRRA